MPVLAVTTTARALPDVGRHYYDPNARGGRAEKSRKGGGSFGRSQRKEEGIKMMTKLATGGQDACARKRRAGWLPLWASGIHMFPRCVHLLRGLLDGYRQRKLGREEWKIVIEQWRPKQENTKHELFRVDAKYAMRRSITGLGGLGYLAPTDPND